MGIVQIKPDVMPEPIGFSISVGIAEWLDGLLVTLASGGIASQDTSQVLLRLKETSFEAILGAIEKAHPHLDLAAEIALYEQLIQANNGASPLLYAAWFNIGVLFAAAGNRVNAAIAYSNVLALRPDMHGAAINLGLLLEAMGQPEQALATWQRAAQPDEARIALEVQQGRLLEKLGRFAEAERILHRVLVTSPALPDVVHHWVHIRQKSCQWPAVTSDIPGFS